MNDDIYQKLKKQIENNINADGKTTFKDALAGIPKKDHSHLRNDMTLEIKKEVIEKLKKEYKLSVNKSMKQEQTYDNGKKTTEYIDLIIEKK